MDDDDDRPLLELHPDRYPRLRERAARARALHAPASTEEHDRAPASARAPAEERMVPLVEMAPYENLKRGDRVTWHGHEQEYTVERTPVMDEGPVHLSRTVGTEKTYHVAKGDNRRMLRAVRPPQQKLSLHGGPWPPQIPDGPCVGGRVVFVDPLNHTTTRDRRMLYELQALGYRLEDMRSYAYTRLKKYIADTDQRSKVDSAEGSFCAAPGTLTTPAGWMRGLMQASHELRGPGPSSYRYYYVMACSDAEPLSVLIYGYGTVAGQVEVVALCANQRTDVRARRARGVGRQLLRDLCAVCDAVAAPMKVDSVPTAVSMYGQFGFETRSYAQRGATYSTRMVRRPQT